MRCTEGMCKYRNHTNHTGLNQHKVVTVLDDNKNDYFLDRLDSTSPQQKLGFIHACSSVISRLLYGHLTSIIP